MLLMELGKAKKGHLHTGCEYNSKEIEQILLEEVEEKKKNKNRSRKGSHEKWVTVLALVESFFRCVLVWSESIWL